MTDADRKAAQELSGFVRVRLEVEVTVASWDGTATLVELYHAAHREAPQTLAKALKESGIQIVAITSSDVVIRKKAQP